MFIICSDLLSRTPMSGRALAIAASAMFVVACAPDPGPPESQALFDKLERGPLPMPVREALGIPDAQFVCAMWNDGFNDQAVNIIRGSFDDPVADQGPPQELEYDGDGPDYLYVAAPSGERLIIGRSYRRYLFTGGSDACVRAETGRFERFDERRWVLRGIRADSRNG